MRKLHVGVDCDCLYSKCRSRRLRVDSSIPPYCMHILM